MRNRANILTTKKHQNDRSKTMCFKITKIALYFLFFALCSLKTAQSKCAKFYAQSKNYSEKF